MYNVHGSSDSSFRRLNISEWSQTTTRSIMHLLLSVASLIVVSLLASVESAQGADNFCDLCDCLSAEGIVKSVACVCLAPNEELNITQEAMRGLTHIESFSVSNCSSVNFFRNSFSETHDLIEVVVHSVGHMTLPVGVFSTLNTLLLEDVRDLRLLSKAFMGADNLRNITIHRANISELPSFVLYNMPALHTFELKDVRIDLIKSHAIDLKMVRGASVVIDSCEVDTVEANAVTLHTDSLRISHSHIQNVVSNGVLVSTTKGVNISTTFFGQGCSESGILLESDKIRIVNNTFHTLPIGLLEPNEKGGKIIFQENIVYEFTLGSVNEVVNMDNFVNNEVNCDCILASSIPTFIALNRANTDHITEKNYCHLDSKCKISLKEFSDHHPCSEVDHIDVNIVEGMCAVQQPMREENPTTLENTELLTTSAPPTQKPTQSQKTAVKTTATYLKQTGSSGHVNLVHWLLFAFIALTSVVKMI